MAPRAAAPQSYQGFEASSMTQYQAPPQPRYGESAQPRYGQSSQPRYGQSPPPLTPQKYQATLNTYHPPGPSQPPPSPPRPHSGYAYNEQYPQLVYPTHPPKEQPKAYKPDYYRAPLKIGLDDSAYQSEPLDDVASLLSRMHLDNRPTATTALRRLNLPLPEDGIYRVIRDVLTQGLETENNNEMIRPDHPCFDKSWKYARRWRISNQAIDNHIRLACGYLKFPVMMLLNPSPNHETLSLDEMVRECKTLVWIRGILREIGLTLADVIILDICTLLDDRHIGKMDEDEKDRAMYEAYNVTWEMLQMIKPKITVSCQCSSSDNKWGGGTHEIAKELCSSVRRAERGQVKETYIEGRKIHVVQAYHPGGFLNYSNHEDPNGECLKRLLLRVYRPCGWELKRKGVEAKVASMNNLINELGHIYGFAHGYLGFQLTSFI